MAMDIVLYGVAMAALVVASYTDLKTREVPDWISYGLMFSGLGLRLLFSVSNFDWLIFLEGVAGFLLFVGVGYLMYYTGQWGGGDSKLLMGLGAIIGLKFTAFPDLLVLFVNILLTGAVYGVIWIGALTILHYNKIRRNLLRSIKKVKGKSYYILAYSLTIILLSLVISRNILTLTILFILALLPLLSLYLFLFVKVVEKVAMYKLVLPTQLTEGDWLVDNVVVGGQRIAGPKDLGVSKIQINELIRLHRQKKIKKIMIKNGIPFVPSFLIGFLITVVFGNWLQILLS
jgi:Flp pilus assembly protein protease CpaA